MIRKMKKLDFTNKVAVITGGAGLLGRTYASSIAECGADVYIFDKKVDEKKTRELIRKEYKLDLEKISKIHFIECDITKSTNVQKKIKQIEKKIQNLKILINNASLVKQVGNEDLKEAYKPFMKMSPVDWEEYLSVDITGALLMTQNCIPIMQKNGGGSIINISSTYGILSPDQRMYEVFNKKLPLDYKNDGFYIEKPIGYSISKSAVLNMTRFLATKFAKDGIRVNTLTLGGVYDNNPKEFVKEYSKRTPLNRMANRTEYVGPILFLASEMSSYMTGSNLIVDGGWSAW